MNRQKKIQKPKVAKESKFQLDNGLILKAASILKKLHTAEKESTTNLFEMSKNPFLYINVILNALPSEKNIKPMKIDLPVSLYGQKFSTKQVLIVSNQFKQENKTLLRTLKENWKFISYEKISKNYKQYKDKLALLKDYDLFFAEGPVYILLKKHLGKHFYDQKRYPAPVDFSQLVKNGNQVEAESFKNLLNSLIENSTYFVQGNGPEYSLKVARVDNFSEDEILKNIKTGVKNLLKLLIERGLKLSNIRRIIVKGEKTESLPIYSFLSKEEKEILVKIVNGK